jgi:predicted nucleic acid-binding Zn ribbon protein
MVYCPKCGTANPRESRFCNECGAPLPIRTALRCPMCGTMNPVGNTYCDRCRARLIPMAVSPAEEAEPQQAPMRRESNQLKTWLREPRQKG